MLASKKAWPAIVFPNNSNASYFSSAAALPPKVAPHLLLLLLLLQNCHYEPTSTLALIQCRRQTDTRFISLYLGLFFCKTLFLVTFPPHADNQSFFALKHSSKTRVRAPKCVYQQLILSSGNPAETCNICKCSLAAVFSAFSLSGPIVQLQQQESWRHRRRQMQCKVEGDEKERKNERKEDEKEMAKRIKIISPHHLSSFCKA
jgi:hypothetical protein